MASARRIQLIRTPVQVFNPYTSMALRFTVDTANAYLMDGSIFRLIRSPVDPTNPSSPTRDAYLGVCSVGDLSNLPVNNPTGGVGQFRSSHIDVNFPTESAADDAWNAIVAAVTALKNALDANDTLGTAQTTWVGTPPS